MGEYADYYIEDMLDRIDRDISYISRKRNRNLAAVNKTTVFISGKIMWAKVLGEPALNYSKDGRQWSFEVELDEKSLQTLIKHGLADRIKGKGYKLGTKGQHKDREPFIQFRKTELNKEGNKNDPIRIYDAEDNKWDPMLNDKGQPTNLIGNGSLGDVKLSVRDYGVGKQLGVYPDAIRITEHVEYEGGGSEFGSYDNEGDETPAKPAKAKAAKKSSFESDFDLDDDVPLD